MSATETKDIALITRLWSMNAAFPISAKSPPPRLTG